MNNPSQLQDVDERRAGADASEPLPPGRVGTGAVRTDAALRRAYVRGRRDERARRRGAPIAAGVLVLTACAAVFMVALSIREGSFSRGAEAVDQHIASVTEAASRATRDAAARVGDALRNAGDELKRSASH